MMLYARRANNRTYGINDISDTYQGFLDADKLPDQSVATGMLELALRLHDEAMLGRLLHVDEVELAPMADTWIRLTRYGYHDRAAQLVRHHWKEVDLTLHKEATYDKTLAEALPKTLEKIDDPDLRYLAEVIYNTAPDPEGKNAAKAASSRLERLEALAKRFSKIEFSESMRRLQALELLGRERQVGVFVVDPLREIAEKVDLLAWAQSDNSMNATQILRLSIAIGYMRATVWMSDPKPITKTTTALLELFRKGDTEYYHRVLLMMLETPFENGLARALAAHTPEEVIPFHDLTRMLMFGYQGIPYAVRNDLDLYRALHFVIHEVEGSEQALADWRKQLTDDQRKLMPKLDPKEVWVATSELLLKPKPISDQRRHEILLRICVDPVFAKALAKTANTFHGMVKYKALKPDELSTFGLELAKKMADDQPDIWFDLAAYMVKLKQEEAVPAVWKAAVERRQVAATTFRPRPRSAVKQTERPRSCRAGIH